MIEQDDVRTLRCDAERNRHRLIEAASAAFAEEGFDVSIEEIARRAGLGKGTVFRRFPTKEHLVAAIVRQRLDELTEIGAGLLNHPDSGGAMEEFMGRAVATLTQDRGLLEAIHGLASTNEDIRAAKHRVIEMVKLLLSRGQASGSIRADVTACDIMLLVAAISHVAAPFHVIDDDIWKRYLGLIFDGLRPEAAHACSHPPPTEEQMQAVGAVAGQAFQVVGSRREEEAGRK